MKKFTLLKSLILVAGVFLALSGWGQGFETFTNSTATATYANGSFTGDDGFIWTFGHSRNEEAFPIQGKGLMLRRASDSYLEAIIPGGIGDFSFEYRKAFTGTSVRQLELIINGVQVATSPEFGTLEPDPTIYTFTANSINVEGNVTVRIKNVGTTTTNRQTVIDNISWTGFGGGNFPPIITNITQTPDQDITSSTTVTVSADVTDPDGTVELVELRWGTATGVYPDTIPMSLDAGDTYTTQTDIPAQSNGTTVYYTIYAEDNDADFSVSPEQSYDVFDPPGLPYTEDFSGFVSSVTLPDAWSVSNTIYEGDWGTGTGAGLRGNANVLGFQHTSGTGVFTATLTLLNNTGQNIKELFISYLGMVERAAEGRSPEWTVELNDVVIPGLFYSTFDGVDKNVSALIQGLSISNNEIFTIKWSSDRGLPGGSSKQIGIGDVSISMTESYVLIGATDDASNYATWIDGSNEGYGFGQWSLTSGTDGGFAGFFLGNPADEGITGMNNPSFALFANPSGDNFANADRNFITPLGVGSTFSVNWGVNWDSDGSGNKGINLYAGGTSGTQIININMGGSVAITINGNPMFNNYGTQVMTLNLEYISEGQLRVYGTGRDGSETYDQTISVAGSPDAVRFYASGLAAGDERQPYFNNLAITTDPAAIPVDATVTVKGQVELNANLEVENLIIETGQFLQINPGVNLTVNGTLNNDNAGSKSEAGLLIKSDATGTGSLINNTSGVDATVERYIAAANWADSTLGWHLLSSPVSGQAIDGIWTPSGVDGDYDFYAWDESNVEFPWLNQKEAGNGITQFNAAQGYLVAYEQTGIREFVGPLNAGEISFTLLNSEVTKNWTWEGGWNLIGNPYPSGIDWSLVDHDEVTSLFQDVYAYIYNTNKSGGAGYEAVNGTLTDAFIAAHQGFFVLAKASSDNIDFTFTNDMRVHEGTFLKSDPENYIRLRLAQGGFYDETTIWLKQESKLNRDPYDALKMFSFHPAVPQVYSMTQDDVWVAINSIPEISESMQIPVSIRIPANGSMSLSISGLDGEFANQNIILLDLLTGESHDFSQHNEYHFTGNTSDSPDRFQLKFEAVGIPEVPGSESLQAWVNGNILYVMNSGNSKALVEVYNIQGQVIMSHEVGKVLQSLPANVAPGTYIIRMISEVETATRKVVIQ